MRFIRNELALVGMGRVRLEEVTQFAAEFWPKNGDRLSWGCLAEVPNRPPTFPAFPRFLFKPELTRRREDAKTTELNRKDGENGKLGRKTRDRFDGKCLVEVPNKVDGVGAGDGRRGWLGRVGKVPN